MRTLALSLLLAITGCSYTHQIGQVGPLKFHKVQVGSITAPGQTFVVIEDTKKHQFTVTDPIGGNGVLSAAVLAAGGIGSSLAIADGLDSDQRIHITDDSPAPPIDPQPPIVTPPPVHPPDTHPNPPGHRKHVGKKHKWD